MKRILFIAHHRPDRSPSQRFRFEQYIDYLRECGFSCELSYLLDEEDDRIFYQPGHFWGKLRILLKSLRIRWRDVKRAHRYDAIVVHREALMIGTSFFERAFARRSRLIYDFDDAVWLPSMTSTGNKPLAWLKRRPQKVRRILRAAKLVWAGNDYLADFARRHADRVEVVPTTIDTQRFHPAAPADPADPICIGWTGSDFTLPYLQAFEPVLAEVKARLGARVRFKFISATPYHSALLENEAAVWSSESEVAELQAFDIGIMPMPDDPWTRGKCGCKLLQYMALELPSVAANVGTNREIVVEGETGYLCDDPADWVEHLVNLVEDAGLRRSLGRKARRRVEARYSVEAVRGQYVAGLGEKRSLPAAQFSDKNVPPKT